LNRANDGVRHVQVPNGQAGTVEDGDLFWIDTPAGVVSQHWSLKGPGAQHKTVRIEPAFESNDGELIRSWVIAGLGITERSEWSIADDLRTNRLVRVLGDWSLPDADIVALINPRSIRAARIDCFLSHLSEHFAQPQGCAG